MNSNGTIVLPQQVGCLGPGSKRSDKESLYLPSHFGIGLGNLYFPYPQVCVLRVCTSLFTKEERIHEEHCESPPCTISYSYSSGHPGSSCQGTSEQRVTIMEGVINLAIGMRWSAVRAGTPSL